MFLGGRNICLIKKVDFMSLSDKAADNLPGAFLLHALSSRNRLEAVRRGGHEVLHLSPRRACGT